MKQQKIKIKKILNKYPKIKKTLIYILFTGLPFLHFLLNNIIWSPLALLLRFFKIRFIPFGVDMIGHLAGEPDCYLKEQMLKGEKNKYIEIILAPNNKVVNMHLLNYWDKYFYIVKTPILCKILKPLSENILIKHNIMDLFYHPHATGKPIRCYDIYSKYTEPVIKISEKDIERGNEWLRSKGVPENSWFVAMHARDSSFNPSRAEDQSFRDCDIRSYQLAINSIIDRGGWCVRVGKNRKHKLDENPRVIESDPNGENNEWLDMFLCSRARFFLGCTSGFLLMPTIFGTPVVQVNISPMTVFPFKQGDLGIPKLVYEKYSDRYLTFREVLQLEIASADKTDQFEKLGLRLVDNSPKEIKDIADEMMDLLDDSLIYNENENEYQEKLRKLLKPNHYGFGYSCRIGRKFLEDYPLF